MSDPASEWRANAVMIYRCTNPECGQNGVDKHSLFDFDQPVLCGECGQELTGSAV